MHLSKWSQDQQIEFRVVFLLMIQKIGLKSCCDSFLLFQSQRRDPEHLEYSRRW